MLSLPRRIAGLFGRYRDAHPEAAGRGGAIRGPDGRSIGRVAEIRLDETHLRVRGEVDAPCIALVAQGRRAETIRPAGVSGTMRFDLALPRPETGPPAIPRAIPPAMSLAGAARPDEAGRGPAAPSSPRRPRIAARLEITGAPDHALRLPGPGRIAALQAAGFAFGLVRLVPALAGWALSRDERHRATVKRVLGLVPRSPFGPLDPEGPPLAGETPATGPGGPRASIVLPVHDGFDLLTECLARLERHTGPAARLILIEDGSRDPRVRPWLRERAAALRETGRAVELIEPARNLGFVGAVNLGLAAARAQAPDGPVVLLNSDAFVPEGWLARLLAPFADPEVASVTPMSNDAEIATVPVICARADLPPRAAEAIDAVARGFDPARAIAEMPTGVGFCMALSPVFLARVPQLDTAFGRGYGEEVDWCQRIRAMGGRHLGTLALFVEHRGGASFGSEEKARAIRANNALIASRYPAYDTQVQRFIRRDPLRTGRLALAMAWAGAAAAATARQDKLERSPEAPSAAPPGAVLEPEAAPKPGRMAAATTAPGTTTAPPAPPGPVPDAPPTHAATSALGALTAVSESPAVPLYLAHSLGGGAEHWLAQRVAGDLGRRRPSAVLRVGGETRFQLELHTPQGITGGTAEEIGPVAEALAALPRKRIVYSCGVGDPDPVALPGILLGLRRPSDTLEVLLHDWLPVSPSYTTLDRDGGWRGPVGPDRADPAHRTCRPDGRAVPLAEWQAGWGRLLRAADRVRLFSEAGRTELAAAYPDLDPARIEVRPHPIDPARLAALRVEPPPDSFPGGPPGRLPVIGVIGNLNAHKGAGVVAALAKAAPAEIAGVVVLGRVDPACPLPRRVWVHGGYEVEEIPALVRRHGITHWLLPAIWPETFSYAVHEALATGLPVLAFDLGAQGLAVRAAPNGRAVPFGPGTDPVAGVLRALRPEEAMPAGDVWS